MKTNFVKGLKKMTQVLLKTRYIAATLIALLAMFNNGCQEQLIEDLEQFALYDASKPVSFTTQLAVVTRGTPINSVADMTSMGVFAAETGASEWNDKIVPEKMFNIRLNQENGAWTYAEDKVFWEAEELTDRFSFFAYAPFAEAHNGIEIKSLETDPGIPRLTYTVPITVTNQPDLMIAVPRYNLRPVGNVPLQMKHALTSIGFKIAGKGNEKVTGISISGVSVSGELSINGNNIVWENLAAPTDIDFSASLKYDEGKNYYSVTENMSDNLMASDGYLMMIPQTLKDDAKVTITFDDKTTKEINLNSRQWEAGSQISYNITLTGSGTIMLTPDRVMLSPGEHLPAVQTIAVISQKADGTHNPDIEWTLDVPASNTWLTISLDSDLKTGVKSISGKGTQYVYIYTSPNNTGIERDETVTLRYNYNGEIAGESVVTQNKELPSPEAIHHRASIAGAFWRHNQTGERIVQVNVGGNSGAWTAMVTFYDKNWDPTNGDGVLLAKSGSLDEALGTNNPDDAENHQMTGYNYTSSVSGIVGQDEEITFRIGLEKKFDNYSNNPNYTNSFPARYAVIELWYNNHTKMQNIYLRQGEGDDYLMRKSDTGPDNVTRTNAARFSPYNLTATQLNKQVNSSNPAIFTEYPSQIGAFFQYATTKYKNYAWDPYNPDPDVVDWEYIGADYDYSHEIGPTNYRRPKDEESYYSEIRQSLWKDYSTSNTFGNNKNFVYGYYADGFYDRRISEKSTEFRTNGVVSAGNRYVAYGGGLFFNPATNASLFFPIGGYRYNHTGVLDSEGFKGYYLTSAGKMITLQYEDFAAVTGIQRPAGINIRSVRN